MNQEENRYILFGKCIGATILLTFIFCISALALPKTNTVFSIIGILAYFILGHIYIEYLAGKLWCYLGEQRKAHKLTASLGSLDIIIYAVSFAFGIYPFIGIWLSIKIASRLVTYSRISNKKQFIETGERKNAYLIGNMLSLIVGLSDGFLIKILFNHQLQEFLSYLNQLKQQT